MQEQSFEIEDITIEEYFNLENTDDYDIFLEAIKANNSFAGHTFDVNSITYNQMEVLKNTFKNPDMSNIFYIFVLLFKIQGNFKQNKEEIFYNQSIFDLFRAKRFLQEFLISKIETENKMLQGVPDDKMMMINGYERLAPVSFLLSKIRLAEQFNTTPDVVGGWKYNTVFSYLIANKINSDIQTEYQKLK